MLEYIIRGKRGKSIKKLELRGVEPLSGKAAAQAATSVASTKMSLQVVPKRGLLEVIPHIFSPTELRKDPIRYPIL